MGESATMKIRGFTATKNEDGTWNVLDVPVFSEVAKGEKNNRQPVGLEWMKLAVKRALLRAKQDGYLAPAHVNHHGLSGGQTQRAGFFLPKRITRFPYEGKARWTVFADLLQIPNDVFEAMDKGELPYRSVEIHNWDTPEINSIALLDSEVPFFRFQIMRIGKKMRRPRTEEVERFKGQPALACFSSKRGTEVLMAGWDEKKHPRDAGKFAPGKSPSGGPPAKKAPKTPTLGERKKAEIARRKSPGGQAAHDRWVDEYMKRRSERDKPKKSPKRHAADMANDGKETAMPDPDVAPDAGGGEKEPSLKDVVGALGRIEASLSSLTSRFSEDDSGDDTDQGAGDDVEIKVESDDEDKAPVEEFEDVEEEDKEMCSKPKKMSATPSNVIKLSARVAGLEDWKSKRENQDRVNHLVASALDDLSGYPVSDETEAKLALFASKGEDVLNAFVSAYKESVPPDGEDTLDTLESNAPRSRGEDTPEVATFAARGPEVLAMARKLQREYAEIVDHHPAFPVKLETFLDQRINGVKLGR